MAASGKQNDRNLGRDIRSRTCHGRIFMAWYFARFTNRVAESGKAQYQLPMYVNAALIRPVSPGQYPSAGPLPHLIDIWPSGRAAIDFFMLRTSISRMLRNGCEISSVRQSLFIPEMHWDNSARLSALRGGEHDADRFSPFSIESAEEPVRGSLQ